MKYLNCVHVRAPVFSIAMLFLAAVGDFVQEDEPLGEVETDKVRVMNINWMYMYCTHTVQSIIINKNV